MKNGYSIEYLKSVREYLINPENAETLEDIIERLNYFFEYIKLQHDDNSRILVVTHNGIMRIIKKFYLNEVNNIDSQNLGQFKMILKNNMKEYIMRESIKINTNNYNFKFRVSDLIIKKQITFSRYR